jgi:hypothetical protein
MSTGATGFEMSFVIRLNSITLRAFFTNPLFVIAMFSSKMFLYTNKITKRVTRVMVQATRLWTYEYTFPYNWGLSL